jgi:hypothetical protein
MTSKHCRRKKEDGFYCQAPALHGRDYCRHHLRSLGRRLRMARAVAQHEPYRLVLPVLEDLDAVQVARMHVLDALLAGLLERKLGGLLLYGLQQASSDLRAIKTAPCLAVPEGQEGAGIRAEDYPEFEEEFGLPPDVDLSKPPEVVFPPATSSSAVAAEDQPSPYRSKAFRHEEIAPEDVELEDIYRTQGAEAYREREKELTREAMKEVQQRKREIKRAQYVVEAARRNHELRFGTPEEQARNAAEVKREIAEARAQHRAELEAAAAAKKSPESAPGGEVTLASQPKEKSGTE